MKRKGLLIGGLLLLGSLTWMVGLGHAQAVRSGSSSTVTKDEVIDSSLYSAGTTVDIAGIINGDVYCAGQHVHVHATVHGDVLCVGQDIKVEGTVDGNIRLAGGNVIVAGNVKRNATLIGQTVNVESRAAVEGDITAAGASVTVAGATGRDLGFSGGGVQINGRVGRNLSGQAQTLQLGATADVQGVLDYTSKADVNRDPAAKVVGATNHRQPQGDNRPAIMALNGAHIAYVLVSLTLVALVLVVLFPQLFEHTTKRLNTSRSRTLLHGALVVVLTPLLIILLTVTLVGIPLAGLTGLAWLLLLMLSGPVAAYYVGTRLLARTQYHQPMLIMLAGSVALLLLYMVPVIGFFALLAVGFFGTGSLVDEALGSRMASSPASVSTPKRGAKK